MTPTENDELRAENGRLREANTRLRDALISIAKLSKFVMDDSRRKEEGVEEVSIFPFPWLGRPGLALIQCVRDVLHCMKTTYPDGVPEEILISSVMNTYHLMEPYRLSPEDVRKVFIYVSEAYQPKEKFWKLME